MKLDFWKNLDAKMKRLILIVLLLIILIIAFFIVVKIIVGNNMSYEQMEAKLKNAAEEYYSKNEELLPKEDGNEVSIDATQLVTDGYLKEFEKYNKKEGPNCNGQVFVINNNGHYLYAPNLNCTDYKSSNLTNEIKKQHPIVTEGNGLYQVGEELVYRGEFVNNYVKFANKIWRIVKIDANGYIKILQNETKERSYYDNRYNINIKKNYGINNYEVSRAKEALNALYNDPEEFTDNEKSKISSHNLCIGKRTGEEKENDGSLECKVVTEKKYPLGLIQLNESINPSLDENCVTPASESCANYNYLDDVFSSAWTITAYSKNTYEAFSVFGPNLEKTNRSRKIYMTLYLSNRLPYLGGTGTADDPYIMESDARK